MKEKENKKKRHILRYTFGVLFILGGFSNISSGNLLMGIFMALFGISLLPILYEKAKLNIKYIQIILPVILLLAFGSISQNINNQVNDGYKPNNSYVIQEKQENKEPEKVDISSLEFNENEIELDIKDTKDIILKVLPENADTEDLKFVISNDEIVTLDNTNSENNIKLSINPILEGECEIFAKSINGIESNKVVLKIIDNERIEREKKEAEEQARKEAEEQAKKEAEEQARKQAEEQAKKQAEEQAKQQANKKPNTTTTTQPPQQNSGTQNNSNNTQGKVVYRTPKGKRYHFDPDCGGKNSYQTTLDAAKSSGLTPCQKCAK